MILMSLLVLLKLLLRLLTMLRMLLLLRSLLIWLLLCSRWLLLYLLVLLLSLHRQWHRITGRQRRRCHGSGGRGDVCHDGFEGNGGDGRHLSCHANRRIVPE